MTEHIPVLVRQLRWPLLACLVACWAVDLFYFPRSAQFGDEPRYLASAARLATTGEFWVNGDRAWEMPGTALFFAPAVRALGVDRAVLAIRFMQSLLLALQSVLTAAIASRVFGKGRVPVIAAGIVALYPFFLFYQGLLHSETLFNTLLLASVLALYWWRDRGMNVDVALATLCLCLTAATLVKATLTVFAPVLIGATAWASGAGGRKAVKVLVVAVCLCAAFMTPWWVRNAVVFGRFVPFTTGSGYNLYLGNNPTYGAAGVDGSGNFDPVVVATINRLTEVDRQRAYKDEAVRFVAENPTRTLRADAGKFVRFWNIIPNTVEFRHGLYPIVCALSYGPILLLALWSAFRSRKRWRDFAPFYLIIGYFTAVHTITMASLRYRLPIEPLLIILAAGPIADVLGREDAR